MSDIITEMNLEEIIEATLFVAGEGVEIVDIADKLQVSKKEVEKAIERLKKKLSGENGIHLIQYRSKVQLASNPLYAEHVSSVLNPIREKALTKATLETLAIIAYKQPVTRLEIEEIRGVSCDYTVQTLLEHNMIEVIGRKDVIGKPLLFGTTDEFLKRFDLENLEQLPNQEELLERIRLIREPKQESDSLYFDFKLPDEEEAPVFLEGEEFAVFSSDENVEDNHQEGEEGILDENLENIAIEPTSFEENEEQAN